MKKRIFSTLLICWATATQVPPASAADAAPLDYAAYADALSAYVNAEGFVNYEGLQQDRAGLDRFVRQLASMDPQAFARWSEQDRLALWINAYNALTLKAVIDHYPVNSIRDIGAAEKSVWDLLMFDVMGRSLTLNQIEHEILRKDFAEPRIHIAINCASIGCPPLLNQPYQASRLDSQFRAATKTFLSRPTNFRVDRAERTIYVSSLFDWFGDDFVPRFGKGGIRQGLNPKQAASVEFIAGYVSPSDREFLDAGGRFSVQYLDYDWGLNKQSRK